MTFMSSPAPHVTPLKVLIVDDEEPARRRLADLLDDMRETIPSHILGEASNGLEALALCNDKIKPDVILLDIRMPEMDGIEFAEHCGKLANPPAIIFCTAYEDHAIKAFELQAVDYLLKPIRLPRLVSSLTKLKPFNQNDIANVPKTARRYLSVNERGRITLVPIEKVQYFKAELKYITVVTAEKEFLIEDSLTRLAEEYGERYIRIHRNCLVAIELIIGLEKLSNHDDEISWGLVLKGRPEHLPVSRRLMPEVKKFIKEVAA
jgi:two-component system response regulator AlgR